jgi:molybdopterin converting factor small subunit
MRIRIKVIGALRSKLPSGSKGNTAQLDLETGATVATALERLGLSTSQVHLVMVNGEMDHDKNRKLNERDEVTLFPPVAGGTQLIKP